MSWVQSSKLRGAIEESIEELPRFIGLFYRRLLDQIEGSETSGIVAELEKIEMSRKN